MVVNYSYTLSVEEDQEPIIVMGLIEDYFVQVLEELYCASSGNVDRHLSRNNVIFSASPADLLSRQACGRKGGSDCTLVEGGISIWLKTSRASSGPTLASEATCDIAEQIEFLINNGYLNALEGVSSTRLESITSCRAARTESSSSWQLSYVVASSGAFMVLALGLFVRNRRATGTNSGTDKEGMKCDHQIFDVTSTEDMTFYTRGEGLLSRSGSSQSDTRPPSFYEMQTSMDSFGNDCEGVVDEYEYYHEADSRETIVIDSKLFSLSMQTILESKSMEQSSHGGQEDCWETIALDDDPLAMP